MTPMLLPTFALFLLPAFIGGARVDESSTTEDETNFQGIPELEPDALVEVNFESTGPEEYINFPQASDNAKNFVAPFAELAFTTRKARQSEWKQVDDNGNNLVSLAELDSYILKKLKHVYTKKGKALLLWKAFRPSYIRAYNDAKDVSPNKNIQGTSLETDDYVTFSEFKYTCHYLCIYALMYDVFAYVDGKGYKGEVGEFAGPNAGRIKGDEWDDRRIDEGEWKAMFQTKKVSSSGFVGLQGISSVNEAMQIFHKMDSDNGGMVLLKEWCAYLKKKEEKANTPMGKRLSVGEAE